MDQWSTASSPAALPGSTRSAGTGSAGLLLCRLCLVTRSAGSTPCVTRSPFSDLNKRFHYRCKHNYICITITTCIYLHGIYIISRAHSHGEGKQQDWTYPCWYSACLKAFSPTDTHKKKRIRPTDLGKFIQITIKPSSLKLRSFITFLQVFIVWSAIVAERERGKKKSLGGGWRVQLHNLFSLWKGITKLNRSGWFSMTLTLWIP